MSESINAPVSEAAPAVEPKKVKPKKTPKTKKPASPKKTKPRKASRIDDGARHLASVGSHGLNTSQVRILMALSKTAQRPIDRSDLKEAVGIGRDGLYSQEWLNGLNDLESRGLIRIIQTEGDRKYYHQIKPKGSTLLDKVKSLAKTEKA